MTMTQAIDSDGNRELTHMFSDIDGIGYVDVQTYADFSTQLVHQKIEAAGVCQKTKLPLNIPSLKDFLHKAADPKGGITEYLGVQHPEWATHDLHAFKLQYDVPQIGQKDEILYFCTKNLNLQFVTASEYDNWVVTVPTYQPKTFTNEDFQNVTCENLETVMSSLLDTIPAKTSLLF